MIVCGSVSDSVVEYLVEVISSWQLTNNLEYINISTEGNAVDFGDLTDNMVARSLWQEHQMVTEVSDNGNIKN